MRSVTVSPVAGLPGDFWMTVFNGSHNIGQHGVLLHAWPDGACLLEQELFLVEAFQTMRGEIMKVMGEQRKVAKHGR